MSASKRDPASSASRALSGREAILRIAVALVLACVAPEARAGALAAIAERLPASAAPAVSAVARDLAVRQADDRTSAASADRRKACRTAPAWAHLRARLDASWLAQGARDARFSRIHAAFGPGALDAALALWDGAEGTPVLAPRPAAARRTAAPAAPALLRSLLERTPARAQAP